jgi:flagellar hook-length control protein FliK
MEERQNKRTSGLVDIATIAFAMTAPAQPGAAAASATTDGRFGTLLQDVTAAPPDGLMAMLQSKTQSAEPQFAASVTGQPAAAIVTLLQNTKQPSTEPQAAPALQSMPAELPVTELQAPPPAVAQNKMPDPAEKQKPQETAPETQGERGPRTAGLPDGMATLQALLKTAARFPASDSEETAEPASGETVSSEMAPAGSSEEKSAASATNIMAAFLQMQLQPQQKAPAKGTAASGDSSPAIAVSGKKQTIASAASQPAKQDETIPALQTEPKPSAGGVTPDTIQASGNNQVGNAPAAAPAQTAASAAAQSAAALAVPAAAAAEPPKPVAAITFAPAHDETAPGTAIDKLGLEIATKSIDGVRHFDIRLDPPELGRVQVHLSVDDSGRAQASLVVDKPQTLELLQRDAQSLNRALGDAGLDLSNNGLNFSLREQYRQNDGGGVDQGRDRQLSVQTVVQADASQIQAAFGSYAPNSVRLDIRV